MHAIISGRSRRALIIDGDLLKSLDFDNPSKIVLRQKSDLPYFFGENSDLHILENTTMPLIKSELKSDCNFTSALDLTLISLDSELPDDIREEALEGLRKRLVDPITRQRLAKVLYAEPFPEDADPVGAVRLARREARKFLTELISLQPSISAVKQAWEAIPTKNFGSDENRRVFQQSAVRAGVFRELVWSPEDPELKLAILEYTLPRNMIELFPNSMEIFQVWIENLRSVKKLSADRKERRLAGDRRKGVGRDPRKRLGRDRKEKKLAG
jgi:hypothetical protein